MLSKNFIFTTLFFGVILFCISCLGNQDKKKYKQLYTIAPTDSSNFSVSLDGIEVIKTFNLDLNGKWKLVFQNDSVAIKHSYLIFRGQKVFSTLNEEHNRRDSYQAFANYDKCPDEGGIYTKDGNFLVIGSGDETLICYKIISYEPSKIILYDVKRRNELEFKKIE